jgi:putative membrane protein
MPEDSSERDGSPSLLTRLAISWLTNALVLGALALVLDNVHVTSAGALLLAAAVFGALNTALKPLLRLLTLPLALLTFGVAWFFVSLLMILLTETIVPGFDVNGFATLIEATVIVWLLNVILDLLPGPWQLSGPRRRRRK